MARKKQSAQVKQALKNADVLELMKFMRKTAEPSILDVENEGFISRISGEVDVRQPGFVAFLKRIEYDGNRDLIATNVAMLENENSAGRLLATNVIGLALSGSNLSMVNAMHTASVLRNIIAENGEISDPYFSVKLWIEPEVWKKRKNETLDFIPTIYTRYDSGKPKLIGDHLKALGTADELGISKAALTRLNSALGLILNGGTSKQNNPELHAHYASPTVREPLLKEYGDHFKMYLENQKVSPDVMDALKLDERDSRIKSMFATRSFTAAYLAARKGLMDVGNVDAVAIIDDFIRDMASASSFGRASSPAAALYAFRNNETVSHWFHKRGASGHPSMYMATLYALMLTIHDGVDAELTLADLNTLIVEKDATPGVWETVLNFGTFSHTFKARTEDHVFREFGDIPHAGLAIAAE